MPSPLLLTRDGTVATLTLNRPEQLNTLDFPLMDALIDAAADVARDESLRVVVVRGAGKHFMAGGDLNTFAGELEEAARAAQCRFPGDDQSPAFGDRGIPPHAASGRSAACRARWPASACRS